MTEVAERNIILEGITKRFEQLGNNPTFHTKREKAFNELCEKGLPTPKSEEYKFTNLTKILEKQFSSFSKGAASINRSVVEKLKIEDLNVHKLVFVNGAFSPSLSDAESLNQVTITTTAEAIENNNEVFLENFGKASKSNNDEFLQLNTALTEDGAFIQIDKNAAIEKPIALYFINDSSSEAVYSSGRNLIIANENCEVTFLEYYLTEGEEDSFSNVTTEILIDQYAKVNLNK